MAQPDEGLLIESLLSQYCNDIEQVFRVTAHGILRCKNTDIDRLNFFFSKHARLAKLLNPLLPPQPVQLARMGQGHISVNHSNKQLLIQVYGNWWGVYKRACEDLKREIRIGVVNDVEEEPVQL